VKDYNEVVAKRSITYAIHPKLVLKNHKELSVPLIITDLGHNAMLLDKQWMNRHKALLDFDNDSVLFGVNRTKLRERSLSPQGNIRRSISNLIFLKKPISSADDIGSLPKLAPKSTSFRSLPKILSKLKPNDEEQEFITRAIGAAAYHILAKNAKKNYTELFAISVQNINQLIAQDRIQQTESIELFTVEFADVSR